MYAKKNTTRKKIKKIYKGLNGYGLESSYDPKYATTYGEITLKGIERLIEIFQKEDINSPKEPKVFYDLGSGIGKFVTMVAELIPTMKSKGIELVKERHEKAMKVYHLLKKSVQSRIEFICGSMFDYSIKDASWIFISNLCFSDQLNKQLSEKIEQEVKKGTVIACSVELPFHSAFHRKEYHVPMTWEKSSSIYVYRKL
jgi:hypothetical protein